MVHNSSLFEKKIIIELQKENQNQIIKLNLPYGVFLYENKPEWIKLQSKYIYKSIFTDK